MSIKNMDEIVDILKALANKPRLCIILALLKGEKNVGQLESLVGISQSAVSQHLKRLNNKGLVKSRRDAQTKYYSLNSTLADSIIQALSKMNIMEK